MTETITFTIPGETEDQDRLVKLPARWVICPACDGCATDRGASVECDGPYGEGGNGFTAQEWADQDDDFKEDYLAGKYDRPCEPCKGLGRVQVVNRKEANKADLAAYNEAQREERDYQRMCRMERRMGA